MLSRIKLIIFFLIITLSIFANETDTKKIKHRKFYDQGYEINKHNLMQAYNAPAKINQHFNFFIEGEYLWWQPIEKGLVFGKDYSESLNFDTQQLHLFNFKANFMSGFRVGIGTHHYSDNWTFGLQYTWYNKHSTDSVKKSTLLHSEWLAYTTYDIYSKWKLHFNLLDFEMSRKNVTGKKAAFSPHFNIAGGWLNQAFTVNGSTSSSYASSKSSLIGPKVGIKTFWNIKLVKILANISAAIFYQDFSSVKYDLYDITQSTYTHSIRMTEQYITPNLNLSAGFSFEHHIKRSGNLFLQAMYEISHFWNQNQMRYLLNQTNYTRFDAGSLMLHGITASIRWDY